MPNRRLKLAPAAVEAVPRDDGGLLLRSRQPLEAPARCVGDWLVHWAAEAPMRPFLVEREGEGFRTVTYGEALGAARAIGQALLDLGLSRHRPLLMLSDNSVDHALVQLGGMHAGVPVAPVSPAYSLQSQDLAKLTEIARRLGAGAIYADDADAFARAITAVREATSAAVPVICSRAPYEARHGGAPAQGLTLDAVRATRPGQALDHAFAALDQDTIAKVLFTSGSTGWPKGVVNTQRMLTTNQQSLAQLWPFLDEKPPVLVDWLPWSHTFGGNFNFNMALRAGGTIHVDKGKPAPGLVERTVALLREVAPTLYFNVPRGFDMLLPQLESDAALRENFFSRLDVVFYAAAALPQTLWRRLEDVARLAGGPGMTFLSAWGSTETAPMATCVHWPIERAGVIGLPVPGVELKLVPSGDKLEMRVRGPSITPGHWEPGAVVRPLVLDEEGFLPTGDAGRLEDPADPARGVVFDGRLAENFKLQTGTWVSVGELRVSAIAAGAPLLQDAVVTGHDQRFIGLLIFPNLAACRAFAGDEEGALSPAELCAHPVVRERLRARLEEHNYDHPASSTRIARALLLAEPPSIDGGEITDKGYINQRAVLTRRADQVARLHAEPPDAEVIVLLE